MGLVDSPKYNWLKADRKILSMGTFLVCRRMGHGIQRYLPLKMGRILPLLLYNGNLLLLDKDNIYPMI